jgi:hypothetical protein
MRSDMRNLSALMLGLSLHAHAIRDETETADDLPSTKQRNRVNTCNVSQDEIAERDRPISRQERRQMQRLAKKGRNQ